MNYWRGLRSKEYLQEFLAEQIPLKRSGLGPDLFSHVCHAESEEGEKLSDEEVIGNMLGLLSAAHDTNASTLTSMAYAFAKWPEYQEQTLAEIGASENAFPTYDELKDMTVTGNVFRESLRLWGPSHSMPRGTLKDFDFNGHQVPAGTMVYISPSFTHRMPEYWKESDLFDPSRFASPREEHKAHRYLFMPFGGGAHGCIGMVLAEIQAKVFFWHLLKRFELKLVDPSAPYKLKYTPIPTAADGLRMVMEPRC
jgi:cytochrome P450